MTNYLSQLKNPKWQRKRLEILNRDHFECQNCEDTKSELNVHHLKYGKTLWDVENKYLKTLCKKCHTDIEEDLKNLKQYIAEMQMVHSHDCCNEIVKIFDCLANNPLSIEALYFIHSVIHSIDDENYKEFEKALGGLI